MLQNKNCDIFTSIKYIFIGIDAKWSIYLLYKIFTSQNKFIEKRIRTIRESQNKKKNKRKKCDGNFSKVIKISFISEMVILAFKRSL